MPKFTWPEVSSCSKLENVLNILLCASRCPKSSKIGEFFEIVNDNYLTPWHSKMYINNGQVCRDPQRWFAKYLQIVFFLHLIWCHSESCFYTNRNEKRIFVYTMFETRDRWPRSSPRFCLLFLGNSSTDQRKWAAKRIRRLTEWYDCLLA